MWDDEQGEHVDEAEFDELYDREWSALVGQVTLVCGDPGEAAECVQEAFARAWEHRSGLDADAGGWVRTTALRISVSRWRKARNAVVAWGRADSRTVLRHHDDPGEAGGADPELWEALRALPAAQREALALHHLLDLGVDQVAALVGAPAGTVKARLSRGRAALAARLAAAPPHPASDPTARPAAGGAR